MTIFIIGYMATGKTTFGRALARSLNYDFIDLDFYIEQRFRSRISEIFSQRGEEAFRKMEASMLREVGEFENVVISCGGGTPCFADNIAYMKSRGLTICLNAPAKCIVRRLKLSPGRRPLTIGKEDEELKDYVETHMLQRQPYYAEAEIQYAGDKLENAKEIETAVEGFLARYGQQLL